MILEFKTKRNTNGYRKYLCIDTGAEQYSRNNRHMIIDGAEISTKDYNALIDQCKTNNYKEVDYCS